MAKKAKVPKVDPYIDGLMAKLLDRLTALERKMDTVVSHVQRLASASGPGQAKISQVPLAKPQLPRQERMMYEAICADCSKVCEVPFKPSEERAVYCKTCWAVRKGQNQRPGMPILRPVSLPPKPVSKLSAAAQLAGAPAPVSASSKKAKKAKPAKKTKKKK